MKIHLRLDSVNPEHIRQTVFIDGRNCGELVMDHGAYQATGALLILGAKQTHGKIELELDPIDHDKEGNFKMPEVSWGEIINNDSDK